MILLLPSTAFAILSYCFFSLSELLLRHNPSHIHWIMNNVPYRPFHPYLSPLRRYLSFIQIISHTDEANSRSNRLKYLLDEGSLIFNLDQFTLFSLKPVWRGAFVPAFVTDLRFLLLRWILGLEQGLKC